MKKRLLFFLLFLSLNSFTQEITGNELLEKAIKFHDPNGNWKTFKGTLWVTMETPNKPNRNSEIKIDIPQEFFYVKAKRGVNVTEYTVLKNNAKVEFNGKTTSEKEQKQHKLSVNRAFFYKNYYTYLYGLPMKLKDDGTIIHQKVNKKTFKGKEYLVLKVTYKTAIGKDTWYFYFNPETYAMEVYQFFKETKDSGEYVLLSDLETINDIKMPKVRAWYYNTNDTYLGTDILSKK